MAKAKKGDLLSCQVCGLIVTVDEACNCAVSEILCCDEPMAKGKMAAGKARKAAAAPAVKAPAKAKAAVKAKAKAKPKAAKAKPAAKKAVAKKPAAKAKKK